ncbi:shikimate dehydrogenase [Legionella sp. D16C41]|uniref:shikimate dehydrogenase n=1 Tax=Legionella sp. D16C41 TaxID=3402688 RepID=UPI003AF70245
MISHCAVVGNPIAHSLSPVIHQYFANQANKELIYEKIQGDDKGFEQQITDFFNQGGRGLNITLPFKERAFKMAQQVTPRCLRAKAANTLWMQDQQLWADNTDGIGLIRDLTRFINLSNKKILLLGAGGAARGIIGPLLEAKTTLTIVNRTKGKLLAIAEDFPLITVAEIENLTAEFDLIINATSASLSESNIDFLPRELLANKPYCYDLAYDLKNPTRFVAFTSALGCLAYDGLGMLVEQAAEAFLIWHKFKPDTTDVLNKLKAKMAVK